MKMCDFEGYIRGEYDNPLSKKRITPYIEACYLCGNSKFINQFEWGCKELLTRKVEELIKMNNTCAYYKLKGDHIIDGETESPKGEASVGQRSIIKPNTGPKLPTDR